MAGPFVHNETKEIDPQEAFILVNGVRIVDLGPMSMSVDDQSERERTTDRNGLWIMGVQDPEGEFAAHPTSPSIPVMDALHIARDVFNVGMVFPTDDPRGTITIEGCKLQGREVDDIEHSSNYMTTYSWEGMEVV